MTGNKRISNGSSETAAIEILNGRPIIALDDKAYDSFIASLDAPMEANARLKELIARRPSWER